jgi:multicomponent Na+:H+ antiporter subunit F
MVALGVVLAFILLCIIRAVLGPSLWDRLLGLNLVTSKVLIIIVLFSYIVELPFLLDLALIYALIGFVGTIFTAMFLMDRVKEAKK